MSQEIGLEPLAEFSGGKGFHFWYIFDSPVTADLARGMLGNIKHAICNDLSAFNMEVFPKQRQLSGKGLGNLVKLPLGVHRLTGKCSYFIECRDRSTEAQLNFLASIKPADSDRLTLPGNDPNPENVLVHPRWQKWAEEYPELFTLEKLCPPLAQVMATCRHGDGISQREEKVLFQTLGFLLRHKTLIHYLMKFLPDYNPHLIDFKLSRLRGTPLGCRRIHSLLNFNGDMCRFNRVYTYHHPLLHLEEWGEEQPPKAEKTENLASALEALKLAMTQVQRFLT
jgi:hypothetical protein